MTGRTLADWLGYLEQLHPSAIDMGLERVRQVAVRLGLGRPARQVVTVTGTNGKGSTCAFIEQLLRAQGARVGVYSSPHLQRYNERVRIDGAMVDDAALCQAFEQVEAARGDTSLTYFEMGTLAALWLFERQSLDVAVLEVGLGGRLDAVNLIDADVAVVTNIGLDHAEWLGDSRESVAMEKAGIFRAGRPAVCGDLQPPETLLEQAEARGATLFMRGRDFDLQVGDDSWSWQGLDGEGRPLQLPALPLLDLPMGNAALALQAFMLLGRSWRPESLAPALRETRIAGRFDRRQLPLGDRCLNLLLDVGHNPHAAVYLGRRLSQLRPVGRRVAVFGLLADKDLEGVLDALVPCIDEWIVCPLQSPRSRTTVQLQSALAARGAAVRVGGSVTAALDQLCSEVGTEDEVLVFGSFFCVAECLDWLERRSEEMSRGLAG